MTVLTYACSLTATVASWKLLNSAAKWDLTWQELFLAAYMMPWFSFLFFFYRSSRASASAPCQIWGLSLDKQINNAERKKQLATCSMSEEHREFSGPARQTLGLNAWLIGDVINPLQLRLLGLFKIGFCFYWCWSFVQLLINQVFFFFLVVCWSFRPSFLSEMIVWAGDPMHSSTLILSWLRCVRN